MIETQKSIFLALVAKIAHGTTHNLRQGRATLSPRFNKSLTLYQIYLYDLTSKLTNSLSGDDTCFRDFDAETM